MESHNWMFNVSYFALLLIFLTLISRKEQHFDKKNVNQQNIFFFNIDNKEKCYLNTKLAY